MFGLCCGCDFGICRWISVFVLVFVLIMRLLLLL